MAGTKSEQILVETSNLGDLNTPLTKTSRLRYTSLSVSDRVIALGSNTGGIYIFSKTDCKLLQVAFAEKETAAVTQLLISPNERFVAFTVNTGKVHVIDLKLDTRAKSETLKSVTDFGGAIVMCLKWCATSSKLFIGDDMGKVTMVQVHTSKAKNLFSIPSESIMKLDSAVIQIDKAGEKLLVSTLTRTYLCDTSKQQYTQIGKKPRDGHYGACFLSQGSITSMIYCARPGSRIWEVDMEGAVLNTHQFKQLLAVSPLSIVDKKRKFTFPDAIKVYPGQSVSFPKLKIISETFLLTWNSTTIFILDPVNVRLILWTNHFNGITDICCLNDELYVFLQSMQVHCLSLMPVSKAIHLCMEEAKLDTVARLCCFYGNILHRKHLRRHLGIPDLYKIHNELVQNGMNELSTSVLSCIKDIESKVAMETDTETSDSNRSRSSSVLSANSEFTTPGTESLQCGSSSRESTDSLTDDKNILESANKYKSAILDRNNKLGNHAVLIDELSKDTEVKVESKEMASDGSHVGPLKTLYNGNLDELDGSLGASDNKNKICDSNETVLMNETNPVHNVDDKTMLNQQFVEDMIDFGATNKDGEFMDGENSGIERVQIRNMLDLTEVERGEPDGNSHGDEFDDNNAVSENAGQEINASNDNSVVAIVSEPIKDLNEHSKHSENALNQMLKIESNASYKAVNDIDEIDENESCDVSSLRLQVPWKSPGHSPVTMAGATRENSIDMLDDDEAFIANGRKGLGARRQSLTSLSSFSSAEVTFDQPSTDGGEKIAIQVKRRPSSKKTKKRKSASDIKGSPSSLNSFKIEESTTTPVEDIGDLDNISQSSEGNKADTTDGGVIEPLVQERSRTALELPLEELDKSEEFLHSSEFGVSGEFQKSSEWGVSGEFSTAENVSGSPSSAPKAAFLKFKVKMHTQVTTKTKKFIQNIKDKNLLTKAKEIAETFSQNSDIAMTSGGYFQTEQFENFGDQTGIRKSDSCVTEEDNIDGASTTLAPLVDVSDLQEITNKLQAHLENAESLNDLDTLYKLLEDWLTVLNTTFHRFHVIKYAASAGDGKPSVEIKKQEKMPDSSEQVDWSERESGDSAVFDNAIEQTSDQSSFQNHVTNSLDGEMKSSNFEKILSDLDFCYLNDPLGLPLDLSKSVSQLVQACFEIGCHGNILTYQKLVLETKACCDKSIMGPNEEKFARNKICDKEKTMELNGAVIKEVGNEELKESANDPKTGGFECSAADKLGRASCEKNVELNGENSTEIESDSKQDNSLQQLSRKSCDDGVEPMKDNSTENEGDLKLENDCDNVTRTPMNFFIRLYYPYLHVHRINKETLQYPEWSALVTCLQGCAINDGERLGVKDDSIISHILESRNQKNGNLTLLGHVSRLFVTKHPVMVDTAIKCFPHLQPIDVLFLCQFHKVSIATVFKQYMHRMLLHLRSIHKPDVEECLFSNAEVRKTWLDMLLGEESMLNELKDSDGNPRPMSNRLVRKNQQLVDQVLSKLSDYQPADISHLLFLFYKHGYWNGVLQLLKDLRRVQEHCKIILHLGDLELLSDSHPLGYLPGDIQEWEYLLFTFKELTKAENQNQDLELSDRSSTVTWNSLAILLVRIVGPDLALTLLEKCSLEEGDVNAEFYQTCLLSSIVQKHKRSILHSMLEKVDMYLWSQRPPVIMPQVHYLLVNENRLKSEPKGEGTSHVEETVQSLTAILKGDNSVEHTPFLEDPECHWGVTTKFNLHCGCCSIPLKEAVSHTDPGVLLFRCGHGFHKQCLPERECVLCGVDSD